MKKTKLPIAGPSRCIAALECATLAGGVALAEANGRLIAQRWRLRRPGTSHALLAELQSLMVENGVVAADIAAVAVSHGPGSFTGIRAGLTVAKTLAHAWACPLFAMSTLEGLAWRLPAGDEPICSLLDARRDELYRGWYRAGTDGRLAALRPDAALKLPEILEEANELGAAAVRFTGDGAALHADAIRAALGHGARFAPDHLCRPAAEGLALAAAARMQAGEAGLDPLSAAPLYLRLSEAEVNLAGRKAREQATL